MRIDMGQVDKCGTFVRDGAGKIALVLGTIEQPDRAQASSYDEIAKFYAAYDPPVRVMPAIEAANTLDFLLGPAAPRTLALRDYYSGWEAVGCQAHGGKPLLLKSSPTELQIFFDGELCTNRCRPSIPHPLPSPFPFPSPPSHSPPPYPPHKLGDVLEPPLDNPRTQITSPRMTPTSSIAAVPLTRMQSLCRSPRRSGSTWSKPSRYAQHRRPCASVRLRTDGVKRMDPCPRWSARMYDRYVILRPHARAHLHVNGHSMPGS